MPSDGGLARQDHGTGLQCGEGGAVKGARGAGVDLRASAMIAF